MLPGRSTPPTVLFHGCGNHLKLLECGASVKGGRVRSTTTTRDRCIVRSAKRNHSSASNKLVSCCLRTTDLPKKLYPDVWREEDYTPEDRLCVSHWPGITVLPVCSGVVSIEIGLKRTEHAYYSQMRVGSVCHRTADVNWSGVRVVLLIVHKISRKGTDIQHAM